MQKILVITLVESLKNWLWKLKRLPYQHWRRSSTTLFNTHCRKYHHIKLTKETFSKEVWHYPGAVDVMKMAGWEEDGYCARLRNESDTKVIFYKMLCNAHLTNAMHKPCIEVYPYMLHCLHSLHQLYIDRSVLSHICKDYCCVCP